MKPEQQLLELTQFNESRFIEQFGGLYEHSPWIAEKVWGEIHADKNITIEALTLKLRKTVDSAVHQQKLDLLCAHPELAGKAAIEGTLTSESTTEQSSARLDLCSPQEYEKFQQLNSSYNNKFNFPFIMAVRNSSRAEILMAFEARILNTAADEFETALEQVHQIALLRLTAAVASIKEQGAAN